MNNVCGSLRLVKSVTTSACCRPPYECVPTCVIEVKMTSIFKIHYFFEKLGWTCFLAACQCTYTKIIFKGVLHKRKRFPEHSQVLLSVQEEQGRTGMPPPWAWHLYSIVMPPMMPAPLGALWHSNISNCLNPCLFQTHMWRIKYNNLYLAHKVQQYYVWFRIMIPSRFLMSQSKWRKIYR